MSSLGRVYVNVLVAKHINPITEIRDPKCTFTISNHFTCTSYPATDAPISTSVKLGEASEVFFAELLRTVRNNTPGFHVAQHFHSAGHSIADVQVRRMRLCSGNNI